VHQPEPPGLKHTGEEQRCEASLAVASQPNSQPTCLVHTWGSSSSMPQLHCATPVSKVHVCRSPKSTKALQEAVLGSKLCVFVVMITTWKMLSHWGRAYFEANMCSGCGFVDVVKTWKVLSNASVLKCACPRIGVSLSWAHWLMCGVHVAGGWAGVLCGQSRVPCSAAQSPIASR
jgi:hypothetical protein